MPYVNIKVSKNAFTRSQKEEVIRRVTEVLTDVLATSPEHTLVFIDELEAENVGAGGESVATLLERRIQGE